MVLAGEILRKCGIFAQRCENDLKNQWVRPAIACEFFDYFPCFSEIIFLILRYDINS
jgi:hypothetical protein